MEKDIMELVGEFLRIWGKCDCQWCREQELSNRLAKVVELELAL